MRSIIVRHLNELRIRTPLSIVRPMSDNTTAPAAQKPFQTRSDERHPQAQERLIAELSGAIPKLGGLSLSDLQIVVSGALSTLEAQLPAAEGLRVVRALSDILSLHAKALSEQVITLVGGKGGTYDGYTVVVPTLGRPQFGPGSVALLRQKYPELYEEFRIDAVDTKALSAAQPDVYQKLVTRGAPAKPSVTLT